jgi:uncharacterized integral membrane protein
MSNQPAPTGVHEYGPRSSSSSLTPKTVATIALAVLALIFVLQNTDKGRITFWFWDITAPAWIWLVVLFVSGVVVGSVFPWLRLHRAPDAKTTKTTKKDKKA